MPQVIHRTVVPLAHRAVRHDHSQPVFNPRSQLLPTPRPTPRHIPHKKRPTPRPRCTLSLAPILLGHTSPFSFSFCVIPRKRGSLSFQGVESGKRDRCLKQVVIPFCERHSIGPRLARRMIVRFRRRSSPTGAKARRRDLLSILSILQSWQKCPGLSDNPSPNLLRSKPRHPQMPLPTLICFVFLLIFDV
jgi:hypothetical protein